MDDRQFDTLVKTLTIKSPRRAMLRTFGGSALAALVGRILPIENIAAKKKHRKKKRCQQGRKKCGKKACCRADEVCQKGTCVNIFACRNDDDCDAPLTCIDGFCELLVECQVDGDCGAGQVCIDGRCTIVLGECQSAGDCVANASCVAGECKCVFPQKPCGAACCAANEACVDGQCVVGQGTCEAGQDICAGNDVTCNGNANCTCGIRLDDGEPRCVQFVNDSRTICTCNNDFRCEQDFGAGTICIKGGASCPDCTLENLGRCATLCPGSN